MNISGNQIDPEIIKVTKSENPALVHQTSKVIKTMYREIKQQIGVEIVNVLYVLKDQLIKKSKVKGLTYGQIETFLYQILKYMIKIEKQKPKISDFQKVKMLCISKLSKEFKKDLKQKMIWFVDMVVRFSTFWESQQDNQQCHQFLRFMLLVSTGLLKPKRRKQKKIFTILQNMNPGNFNTILEFCNNKEDDFEDFDRDFGEEFYPQEEENFLDQQSDDEISEDSDDEESLDLDHLELVNLMTL